MRNYLPVFAEALPEHHPGRYAIPLREIFLETSFSRLMLCRWKWLVDLENVDMENFISSTFLYTHIQSVHKLRTQCFNANNKLILGVPEVFLFLLLVRN